MQTINYPDWPLMEISHSSERTNERKTYVNTLQRQRTDVLCNCVPIVGLTSQYGGNTVTCA
jgi:hypothetical protein